MAQDAGSFRRLLSWWLPAGVLVLAAAFWVGAFGSPLSPRYWLIWPEMLLLGLAWSAGRDERKPSRLAAHPGQLDLRGGRALGMPLDRLLLWAVFGLVLVGETLDGILLREPVITPLLTGTFGLIIAVEMMDRIPTRHEAVIARLTGCGVLTLPSAGQNARFDQVKGQAQKWATACGPVVAVVGLAVWILALRTFSFPAVKAAVQYGWGPLPLMLFTSLGGWIAGERLGRMIPYGKSWQLFIGKDAQRRIILGHPDRVGGFKPVSDFFFYESIIVAIPAIFLAVWSLAIIWGKSGHYAIWRNVYPALLGVTIALEALAFVWPLHEIHTFMQAQKTLLLGQGDQLSRKIDWLQQQLGDRNSHLNANR